MPHRGSVFFMNDHSTDESLSQLLGQVVAEATDLGGHVVAELGEEGVEVLQFVLPPGAIDLEELLHPLFRDVQTR